MSNAQKNDELVPVVNRDTRLVQISWTVEGDGPDRDAVGGVLLRPKIPKVARLTPGVNFVSRADLVLAFGDKITIPRGVPLAIESIVDMGIDRACALVRVTKSRQALKHWLAGEKKAEVRDEIKNRLADREIVAAPE